MSPLLSLENDTATVFPPSLIAYPERIFGSDGSTKIPSAPIFTDSENSLSNDSFTTIPGVLDDLASSLYITDSTDNTDVVQNGDAGFTVSSNQNNVSDIYADNSSISLSFLNESYSYLEPNTSTVAYSLSTKRVSSIFKAISDRTDLPLVGVDVYTSDPLLENVSDPGNTLSITTAESTSPTNFYSAEDAASTVSSWTTDMLSSTFANANEFAKMEPNVTVSYSTDYNDTSSTYSVWDTLVNVTAAEEVFLSPSSQTNGSTLLTTALTTLPYPSFPLDQNSHTAIIQKLITRNMTAIFSSATTMNAVDNGYSEASVKYVQRMAYHISMPVLIAFGLILNLICLIVLFRPRLRSIHVNQYFLALAISDIMVCLMNIPIAVTTNGCDIPSYSAAIYYGYFGWSLIEIWQTISFYTLLFLSYDRFLAVWDYQRFKRQKTPKLIKYRIGITVIADILVHLVFFINVKIWCKDGVPLHTCKPNRFVIEDTYRMNDHQQWHKIYLVIHELVVRWIPGLLLLLFNIGLVTAICMGRLSNPASSQRGKKRMEFRLTVTLIVITCSFIACTFPNTIYSVWFAANIDNKCYGNHEVFRAVSNNLQLLEHAAHVVFLVMLNPTFRSELVNLLTCRKSLDTQNDEYQSSRELQMYQVNRRSGHSPFPSGSPGHSPHPGKRLSAVSNSAFTLAPPKPMF